MKDKQAHPASANVVAVFATLALTSVSAGCGVVKQAEDNGDPPCKQYADKLCKEIGEDTRGCATLRSDVDLLHPTACKVALGQMDYSLAKLAERRKICNELMEKLCKDLGEETQTCAMVRRETPRFPPDRCSSMLEQYDRVVADLKRREEANKPLDEEKRKRIAAASPTSVGPADAKVTVVEFSDFQCPYCAKASQVLNDLKKKYSSNVRFVFRQFPLSFHKDAHLAAQASLAAAAEGKFWQYHDLLFANQKALKREDLEKHAKTLGLNAAKFSKALDAKTYAKQVDADMEIGKEVGVSGTPTLFVNGTRVQDASNLETISGLIDKAQKGS